MRISPLSAARAITAPKPITKISIRHIAWRNGRPRFSPGPKLRAKGWHGEDLRHPGGDWYSIEETGAWAQKRAAVLAATGGKNPSKSARPASAAPSLATQWAAFVKTPAFMGAGQPHGLAVATARDYAKKARAADGFDPALWRSPLTAITRAQAKGLHGRIRQAKGLSMANGIFAVLRLLFGQAQDAGLRADSPFLKLRLPTPPQRLRAATPAEIAALMSAADDTASSDQAVGDAILLGLMTGQRQADVLALRHEAVAEGIAHFLQAKTGKAVSIPISATLQARLQAAHDRQQQARILGAVIIIDDRTGRPFGSASTFRARFAAVRARAAKSAPSVATLRYADLRDTAITAMLGAGLGIGQVAAVSGHSLGSLQVIEKSYFVRTADHARPGVQAIAEAMGYGPGAH